MKFTVSQFQHYLISGFKLFEEGKLVYLTQAAEFWVRQTRPNVGVKFMVGRLAVVKEALDWESEKGKQIMEARKASIKWEGVKNIEDYRYVLTVFFPELPATKESFGLVLDDMVPSHIFISDNETKTPVFQEVSDDFALKLRQAFCV